MVTRDFQHAEHYHSGGSSGLVDSEDAYIDLECWSSYIGTYSTLEVLESGKDTIPYHCLEQYIVKTQVKILVDALKKYRIYWMTVTTGNLALMNGTGKTRILITLTDPQQATE